jgi:6-phosphogluconolactonase/glucosamine-6-phosphate isomerase/deaminase
LVKNDRVLWLVSGGSAIKVAVEVSQKLSATPYLMIGQIDERYGSIDHKDSNWLQLLDGGFAIDKFTTHPILIGQSADQTTASYDKWLRQVLNNQTAAIGLFGIGVDGHTAGILPGSPAADETRAYVSYYKGPDYSRITITPIAIQKLDFAFVLAMGDGKRETLKSFVNQDLPPQQQPAQFLRQAGKVLLYTDQLA